MTIAIPKCEKLFLWFTDVGCYVGSPKTSFKLIITSFMDIMIGSVFTGGLVNNCFIITDVCVWDNKIVCNESTTKRKHIIETAVMYYLSQKALIANYVIVCLPVPSAANSAYPVDYIQYWDSVGKWRVVLPPPPPPPVAHDLVYPNLSEPPPPRQLKQLLAKPDPMTDIYHLFDDEKYYGMAAIQTYKTSCAMNSIFRNIRENANVDLTEESDDDNELFENISSDKWLLPDKLRGVYIACSYNQSFAKWEPYFNHNEPIANQVKTPT